MSRDKQLEAILRSGKRLAVKFNCVKSNLSRGSGLSNVKTQTKSKYKDH